MLLSGCAWMYFDTAGEPPSPVPHHTLAEWPFEEYWTGIVFNGAKIGFTHLSLAPAEDEVNQFDLRSEAFLRFRFLMFDKQANLRSYDRVAADLTLQLFVYDYDLDGNRLKLSGKLTDGMLEVEITSRGQTERQAIPIEGKLYPTSVIGMYPVLHGLELGRHYRYQVYDGETQSIATVNQKILAYEQSKLLFSGKGFKIKTELLGQKVTTWIGLDGKPLLEIAQGGVIISGLESELVAKKYLVEATINKEETLLEYSLIRTDTLISEPARVTSMEVALYGIDEELSIPSDGVQQCERQGEKVICRISMPELAGTSQGHLEAHAEVQVYLLSTRTVPSQDELIRGTANEITMGAPNPIEKIRMLIAWIEENIEQEPVDVFTALDVLARKKGECQGHTYLYAAFARSLEIPTRVVNGIVYSEHHGGFLYHTWAESFVDGHWVAVDPTLRQLPADGTHIKLVEGETFLDLMPLADLVGRLQVEVVEVEGS
jgi:Transglutaminase-like superfamily